MKVIVERGPANQIENDITILVVESQRIEHHLGGYEIVTTVFPDRKSILISLIINNKV